MEFMYILLSINSRFCNMFRVLVLSMYDPLYSGQHPKKRKPEDEKGYYVSSVHIKNYSAKPLDNLHIKS